MIQIHLRPPDQQWATEIGQRRWASSQRRKSKARFAGAKEQDHIDGAGGELAFARALGLPWPATVDVYKAVPDVFPNWEVRTFRRMRGIKVAPEDPDDALVVWVAGKLPDYQIMGYIRAGGAKTHPEWYQDPGGRGRAIFLVPPHRIIEINPGFHSLCAYLLDEWGQWSCAHCGVASGAV